MFPQILVIAYNRPKSLKRLLDSIALSEYPLGSINLVISIDGNENKEVKHIADLFDWKYGNKEIIVQSQRLGLKKHILIACDSAVLNGEFIVLEDDLSVSPFFYKYSMAALNYFRDDSTIAGISLYSYSIAESCLLPFSPLKDEFDNYFIKFPSSWGQCFTIEQWKEFKKFDRNEKANAVDLPQYINDWKGESWKKDFLTHMVFHDKYFVFPKVSLTTNFAEKGDNFPYKMDIFLVPVQAVEIKYKFQNFQISINKFDEYFELLPMSLKKILPEYSDFDFEVDIYGTKEISSIEKKFVLTTKESKKVIKNFGKKLSFQRNNIEQEIDTPDIVLADKTDVSAKIRKPDFGTRIFLHKNEKMPDSLPSYLRLFGYKTKFILAIVLHWIKEYFVQKRLNNFN